MRVYIAVRSWSNSSSLERLKDKCDVEINSSGHRSTKNELKDLVKKYDGIIIGARKIIDKDVLAGSNLKFIGILAKGLDNIDVNEVRMKKIALFYTPKANITSVSEHIMAFILGLSRNLINLDKNVKSGKFDRFTNSIFDVQGKVLGIVGAGAISKELIKRARAFDMKLICYTLHPGKHKDLDIDFVSLEQLLRRSDFVSINIPLNPENVGFIGKKEFLLMKPTAYFINTSRGKVVDEKALVSALEVGQIAGAGIDVFENEPTHNEALFELNNVILTPHIAGVSKEALDRMEIHLVSDIIAFIDGKTPKYRVV